MKRWLVLMVGMLMVIPCPGRAATLKLVMPSGFQDVYLLSPGTSAVIEHMRGRLSGNLAALSAQYNVGTLKQELSAAQGMSVNRSDVYRQGSKAIREQYIAKLKIDIKSVTANISPESSMGEISFTYTATNTSDRIVSDVVYTPRIGTIKIPVASKLVLEFIDATTLKSGLAPGASIGNKPDNPERFSFLLGEISKQDMNYIKANLSSGLALDVQDLHFMNAVGYKDQSQIMDVEHAFQARLGALEQGGESAKRDLEFKTAAYQKAQSAYNEAKETSMREFKTQAGELKDSAKRASATTDKKNRCVFKELEPGAYIVYASDGHGKAVFVPVKVGEGRAKMKIGDVVHDPFLP